MLHRSLSGLHGFEAPLAGGTPFGPGGDLLPTPHPLPRLLHRLETPVAPWGFCPARGDLFLTDMRTGRLMRFACDGKLSLTGWTDLPEEKVDSLLGYDPVADLLWYHNRNSRALRFFTRDLKQVQEIVLPFPAGHFFTSQGRRFILSGVFGPARLFEVTPAGLEDSGIEPPLSPIPNDVLWKCQSASDNLFCFYAAKTVMTFDGQRFRTLAKLPETPFALYNVLPLPGLGLNLAFSLNGKTKQPVLNVHDAEFRFLRSVPFPRLTNYNCIALVSDDRLALASVMHHVVLAYDAGFLAGR